MDKTIVYESLGFVLAFLGLGIAYFAVYHGIRLERFKQEVAHEARMRALDLGRVLPGDEPWWSPARTALAIGLIVPVTVFMCATIASHVVGFHEGIWIAAGLVGLGGVISGSCLAGLSFSTAHQGKYPELAEKPEVAEDAYDVVGSRG
jgi:hypothetical protein